MKKIYLLILIAIVVKNGSAQDLVPYSGQVLSTSLYTNDLFHIRFQIQNVGGTTVQQSYTEVYISPYSNGTGLIPMGFVSCEQLAVGQICAMVDYQFPLPYTIASGVYYVYVSANDFNQVFETNYNNNLGIFSTTINVTKDFNQINQQNIPYPILFVHGWIGYGNDWLNFTDSVLNKQYGWHNGGWLDFCLNADDNVYTGGPLSSEITDFVSTANLRVGDYYFINFDIDASGNWWSYSGGSNSDPSSSNQSAARKQGYAVGWAISYILNLTGADNVILVGHSMGGLACREYLQRWVQSDGLHHVAKLVTVATPNQGSNSTQFGLGFGGSDEKSEAVRDLRRSYAISGNDGVYLFGGWETNSWIQNNILFYYHNVDVNCNGITGEQVPGLDYSSNAPDINYASIIGTGDDATGCIGGGTINSDGIVEDWSANLYNGFLSASPNYIDTFWIYPQVNYNCFASEFLHMDIRSSKLASYEMFNVQALDEPDYFDAQGWGHAYGININNLYYGIMTEKNQDPSNSSGIEYDDYKFTLTTTTNLYINIYNINIPNMDAAIWNINQNQISPNYYSNGKGNISFTMNNVPPGTYYLEIKGSPTNFSWWRAYGFEVSNYSTTDIQQNELIIAVNVFPNPSSGIFTVLLNDRVDNVNISVLNILGEQIFEINTSEIRTEIDLSKHSNGIYFLHLKSENGTANKKLILNK